MAYIDTSVLVAYLCPEPLHARAFRVLNSYSARVLTPLVQVELASALAIKTRTGQSNAASARAVLAQFRQLVDDNLFTMREITVTDYQKAYDWLTTFRTQLRAADAVHLACAHSQREILLTADQVLAQSAKSLNVNCKLIAL